MGVIAQVGGAVCALALAAAPAIAAPTVLRAIPGGVEWSVAGVQLRAEALTPEIVRVRLAPAGAWPEDASWAVSPEVRHGRASVTPAADGFSTAALRLRVDPVSGALSLLRPGGQVITADAAQPYRPAGERG